MVFLANPIAIWILRLCLLVKATGVCDAAWIFAKMQLFIARYKKDTYYIEGKSSGVDNDDDDGDDADKVEKGLKRTDTNVTDSSSNSGDDEQGMQSESTTSDSVGDDSSAKSLDESK